MKIFETTGARVRFLISIFLFAVAMLAVFQVSKNGRETLYRTQYQACLRGNTLRSESNTRLRAHRADTKGLLDFLASAQAAREASYRQTHQASDKAAAEAYAGIATNVKANARFKLVTIVDCRKAVPHP